MTREPRWFPGAPIDMVESAQLADARGFSPSLRRYGPPPELVDRVRRFWVPVWSLPEGEVSVQRVLQYPVCQVVVGHDSAVLVGPCRGLNTEALSGEGWAVGAMMQPAAGLALVGGPVAALADLRRDLRDVAALDGAGVVAAVREAMAPAPDALENQQRACALLADALTALPPADEEGRLINAVVAYVEAESEVRRVSQVCATFGIGERALQRLTRRRIGLSPKWLVQRRRLHEAAGLLAGGAHVDLARVAADLGYADQAHFTRDFRSATGLTPGEYLAEPHP